MDPEQIDTLKESLQKAIGRANDAVREIMDARDLRICCEMVIAMVENAQTKAATGKLNAVAGPLGNVIGTLRSCVNECARYQEISFARLRNELEMAEEYAGELAD